MSIPGRNAAGRFGTVDGRNLSVRFAAGKTCRNLVPQGARNSSRSPGKSVRLNELPRQELESLRGGIQTISQEQSSGAHNLRVFLLFGDLRWPRGPPGCSLISETRRNYGVVNTPAARFALTLPFASRLRLTDKS